MRSERRRGPGRCGTPALAAAFLLLIAGGSTAAGAAPVDSGIVGVVRGPDCALTREGRSCSGRAAATTIEVYRVSGEAAVATARVGPLGTFRFVLVPGRYVLRVGSPGASAPRGRTVRVRPHAFTFVVIQRASRVR